MAAAEEEKDVRALPVIHRPLIPLLAVYMIGIVLGDSVPGWRPPAIAAAAGAAAWLCRGFFCGRGPIGPLLVLFGAWGYLAMPCPADPSPPPGHILCFADGRRHVITGTVRSRPVARGRRTVFLLDVEKLGDGEALRPVSGRIRVSVTGNGEEIAAGCRLRFTARIREFRNFENPGGFDYRRYMMRRGVSGSAWVEGRRVAVTAVPKRKGWRGALTRFRDAVARDVEKASAGSSRAILKALLLGERDEITPRLRQAFNRAGVGHLLAISGLHVGIVAAVTFALFRNLLARCPFFLWRAWTRKGAALGAIPPLVLYGLLAGMSPSTQRAVIMASLVMLACLLEKTPDTGNSLALAALVILVCDPPGLFSVSFQLSFTAVVAIVCGWARLRSPGRSGGRGLPVAVQKAAGLLAVSTLATLGTLPLIMRHFNQVSLVGPFANCLFVPAVGFGIVPAGLLAVGIHPLSPALSVGILKVCAGILERLIPVIHWVAGFPFAAVKTVTPSLLEMGCYYVLGWVLLSWARPGTVDGANAVGGHPRGQLAVRVVAAATLLVLAADAGYWAFRRYGGSRLTLTLIDVGQGSAALLQLPGGGVLLLDGGGFSDLSAFDVGERVVAPLLWRHKILSVDTVALSHPNSDHLNGLPYVLEHFRVGQVWTNGETAETRGYAKFARVIDELGIARPCLADLSRGRVIHGVHFETLHPPPNFLSLRASEPWRDSNNNSLVLRVRYGSVSFLLPGDVMAQAEAELVARWGDALRSTVLVAPHHGSRSSSSEAFLQRVAPEVVAVSAGWQNRYRFPHPEVVARYRERGCHVYRTDRHGAVSFRTDGKRLFVRTGVEGGGWRRLR